MRKDLFDELVESVKQMKAIEAGQLKPSRVARLEDPVHADTPDVAALRARFGLSQAKFAALLGISVSTLQNWEQNRRRPDGPAKVLLRVAAAHPEALLSVTKAPSRRRVRRRAARSIRSLGRGRHGQASSDTRVGQQGTTSRARSCSSVHWERR